MILIGLGANLEFEGRTPVQTMERVLALLDETPGVSVLRVSPWYQSAPVGKADQPDFFNGVASLETDLAPLALMQLLLEMEKKFGRIRGERWGPRTLDLDLLDFDGQSLDLAEEGVTLHLPHPRLHERAFVLRPLLDIAPDWRHPAMGKTPAECLAEIGPDQALRRVAGAVPGEE